MSGFIRESSLVLFIYNFAVKVVDFQVGDAGSVEFDFFKIKNFLRTEGSDPAVTIKNFHMLHVHPPGFGTGASSMDMEVMRGYTKAFGAMPEFSIVTFNDDKITNVMGHMTTYHLPFGDKTMDKLRVFENRYINKIDLCPYLYFLKQASYGYISLGENNG